MVDFPYDDYDDDDYDSVLTVRNYRTTDRYIGSRPAIVGACQNASELVPGKIVIFHHDCYGDEMCNCNVAVILSNPYFPEWNKNSLWVDCAYDTSRFCWGRSKNTDIREGGRYDGCFLSDGGVIPYTEGGDNWNRINWTEIVGYGELW